MESRTPRRLTVSASAWDAWACRSYGFANVGLPSGDRDAEMGTVNR